MIFYRETEFQDSPIGIIPEDWEVTNLRDASLLVTDGSHFSPKHQRSGYPLATVANMRENDIDVDSCYRITKEDYEKLVATGDKPEVNDVLFSKDGTVGQCIVFRQKVDLIVLSSIAIIRPNLKKANPHFLKYMLQSPAALGRITGSKTGSAIKRIILRDLNSIKIALPKKLEEQKRIVEVLTVADSAIELADNVIEKTERLKKGLMQQLLTRGIGHTEYKDTPIGKTPKTWQVVRIGDVAETSSGGTPSRGKKEYFDGRIPWVKSGELRDNTIYATEETISKEGLQNSAAKIFPKGTLLIALYGATVGKTAILGIDATTNQAVCAILPKGDTINPEFLKYYIISRREQLIAVSAGGAQPNISQEIIRFTNVPLPQPQEQRRIAEILLTLDKKLEVERAEMAKLENIKHGLMDLLLTGTVRIKVD
jgi:type I restriction enzyme S subunit